jgi:hypothetical protein
MGGRRADATFGKLTLRDAPRRDKITAPLLLRI